MILRPTGMTLLETIEAIDESDKFAFITAPERVWIDRLLINLTHLLMLGPDRQYASKTKGEGSYHGPIWRSEIAVLPLDCEGYDTDRFKELVGRPSRRTVADWVFTSDVLRHTYDFSPKFQPRRPDNETVVPHIINFCLISGNYREDVEKGMYAEDGWQTLQGLGNLADRILIPPTTHNRWDQSGEAAKIVDEALKAGKFVRWC